MENLNVQQGTEILISIQNLVDFIEQGQNRGAQLVPSISMVSKIYRDQKPSCFDPRVVSIGPLHHASENVKGNEALKASYMHDLLSRLENSTPEQTLEVYLFKVLGSIKEIKACYGGGVKEYDDFKLANMMVTDACFILEFLIKCWEGNGLCPDGDRFVMNHIYFDLVLLENQIPFFVLQDIFDCAGVSEGESLINILLTVVLPTMNPFEAKLPRDDKLHSSSSGDRYYYKHILDVLQKTYQPLPDIPFGLSALSIPHSAVELDLAGVSFKPNQKDYWQMAIEYESSGFLCFHRPTLRMPVMNIHDKTELIFRNLIAYEQSSPVNGYYFTSYACAMDMLVDNKEDVSKLLESKVIVNMLGSNETAANMINNICNEVSLSEFSYESQWKQLDEYCNSYWPKNIARLRRRYFSSPWNMIALVSIVLLFALNVIQTSFTVKSTW